jgi:hypothetical protein
MRPFPPRRDRRRAVAIVIVLVLMVVLSAFAAANVGSLHRVQQLLQEVDRRQLEKYAPPAPAEKTIELVPARQDSGRIPAPREHSARRVVARRSRRAVHPKGAPLGEAGVAAGARDASPC